MPTQQALYVHTRVDASTDLSGATATYSLDKTSWPGSGTYITPANRPPECVAADSERPPRKGLTGYWFRFLAGVGQAIIPEVGPAGDTIYAKVASGQQTAILRYTLILLD